MSDVNFPIQWDWQPDKFDPPFTILYGQGLDYDDEEGNPLYSGDMSTCVSIMGKAFDRDFNTGKAEGKWYVVTGYDVPKGQRRLFAQNMKALVEMRYTQEKQNELR